nr:MAG TPA_asm: hypothetical protein [Bacteriophage sp.]
MDCRRCWREGSGVKARLQMRRVLGHSSVI